MQNDTGPGTDVARGCGAHGKAGREVPAESLSKRGGTLTRMSGDACSSEAATGVVTWWLSCGSWHSRAGQGGSYAQLLGANGHLHGSQGFGLEEGIRMICTDFSLSSLKSLQVTLFLKCFLKSLMQLHACDTEFL